MASYDWIVDISTGSGTFSYGINKDRDGLYSVYYTKSGELRGQRSSRDDAIELAKKQVSVKIFKVDIRS